MGDLMARPEWDLALICMECDVAPSALCDLLQTGNGTQLLNMRKPEVEIPKQQWACILAEAEAAGAITEIPNPGKPAAERCWRVLPEESHLLFSSVELILSVLPDAKRRFSDDQAYRIAATIPTHLHDLRQFFRTFENTALGLRRMIAAASTDLTLLVPFMDAEGFSEILDALELALARGVTVSFLTRELGDGGRNLTVLSEIVESAKRKGGDLRLYEVVLTNGAPISHAKVFARDGGDEVYVGSANLTATSMDKTIEIGVFLRGRETRAVGEFLSLVKSLAYQRWP